MQDRMNLQPNYFTQRMPHHLAAGSNTSANIHVHVHVHVSNDRVQTPPFCATRPVAWQPLPGAGVYTSPDAGSKPP